MSFPLVSIAIPAYNHACYIEACLSSICAQTYPELELVLVDDGSRDETYAMAQAYLARHESRFRRIVLKTRPNRGVSATSNECVALCTGTWVHLLGSDDVIYPDKVMAQQQAIEIWGKPSLALVYADVDYIDEVGGVIAPQRADRRPEPGVDERAYVWLCEVNRIPNPTVALRREAFLDIGGFDETLRLEDWDCWLRLAACYPVARIPAVLGGYRYHPANTSKRGGMMMEAVLLTFAKFLEGHPDLVEPAQIRRVYRKNLRRIWRWARKSGAGLSQGQLAMDFLKAGLIQPAPEDVRRYAAQVRGADSKQELK